jgi:uncharacterized protein YdaU (DUF1376 family)
MAGRPPFFAFYPADFAGDINVEAMTTLQVGAYILLLCKAWQADPPASLPNDDAVLARLARLTPAEWSEAKAGVLSPFVLGADNRWHQKRLRKEFETAKAKSKKRAAAGAAGANARWRSDAIAMRLPCDDDGKPFSGSGSGSGSESGSGSSASGVGGAGGGAGPPVPFAPDIDLAQRWVFELKRRFRGMPADRVADAAAAFAELLRVGHQTEALRAAIEDPARDKNQTLPEFRVWLAKRQAPPGAAGGSLANRGYGSVAQRMAEQRQQRRHELEARNGQH